MRHGGRTTTQPPGACSTKTSDSTDVAATNERIRLGTIRETRRRGLRAPGDCARHLVKYAPTIPLTELAPCLEDRRPSPPGGEPRAVTASRRVLDGANAGQPDSSLAARSSHSLSRGRGRGRGSARDGASKRPRHEDEAHAHHPDSKRVGCMRGESARPCDLLPALRNALQTAAPGSGGRSQGDSVRLLPFRVRPSLCATRRQPLRRLPAPRFCDRLQVSGDSVSGASRLARGAQCSATLNQWAFEGAPVKERASPVSDSARRGTSGALSPSSVLGSCGWHGAIGGHHRRFLLLMRRIRSHLTSRPLRRSLEGSSAIGCHARICEHRG
jgi:hypothetical protein